MEKQLIDRIALAEQVRDLKEEMRAEHADREVINVLWLVQAMIADAPVIRTECGGHLA